jgi:hypothetical protein
MGRKARITSPERIERQQRIAEILSLRVSGWTLQAIGDAMGVSPQAVHKCIRKALQTMLTEAVEQARRLEALRLDELTVGVYPQALKGDLGCIDTVLSIMRRRSRLLGLDAQRMRFGAGAEDRDNPPAVRVQIIGGPDAEHVRRLEERLRELN